MTSPALTLHSQLITSFNAYLTHTHILILKPSTQDNAAATMPEYEQELPENIMTRILQIEDLISTQTATMMENTEVGWLYGGDELFQELEGVVECLREEGGLM